MFHTGIAGNWDIAIISANGSHFRRVTTHAAWDFHPVWSPTGTHIAFESQRAEGTNIFTYAVDSGEIVQLTFTAGSNQQPAWSPDGSQILFNSDTDAGLGGAFDLYTMNADGSDVRRLTSHAGHDEFGIWSPDGTRIAFMIGGRDDQIGIMNADGTGQRALTTGPGFKVPDVWYVPQSGQPGLPSQPCED